MEDTTQDYRVHIMVRRRNEPAFTSNELKSEKFNDLEQMLLEAQSWVQGIIEDDADYLDERGDRND